MKVHATKNQIKAQKLFVLGVGYCSLQCFLLRISVGSTLYNANVYGWRCDFYPINKDLGVVTGYDVDRACDVAQWDLNEEFNDKLRALEDRARSVKCDDQEEIEKLKNNFIDLLDRARKWDFIKQ